jgi:acyl-lipid omega-6 desaturase (Delta-12 desaturase)
LSPYTFRFIPLIIAPREILFMNHDSSFSAWRGRLLRYQGPAFWRSVWQVVNTLVPYCALWFLMYHTVAISFWLTLPLVILAAGFLMRAFIISHDCGHGSFFKSDRANAIMGTITGFLVFTPYYHWRWQHAVHHGTAGDLDKRGMGDVWTLTVQEYLEASRWKRISYRLVRNPFVLFVLAPLILFLIVHRVPSPVAKPREIRSVLWTNVALAIWVTGLSFVFGFTTYLVLQLSVLGIATSIGVWLFYVQHQFEGVYWARHKEWDFAEAALQGSSFYKLPKVLQWFTGNIGFHHIHHLNPQIPNYKLETCHESVPELQVVEPLTFFRSCKSFGYRLWDEQRQRMVGYGYLQNPGSD